MSNIKSLSPGIRTALSSFDDIKAVLFDVDNTLVDNESPQLPTARFLKAAEQVVRDRFIGLATARPYSKVAHILEAIGGNGFSILSNGAQLYDARQHKIVAEWIIPPAVCRDVCDFLANLGVRFWINDNGVDHLPLTGLFESGQSTYGRPANIWDSASSMLEVPDYSPAKPLVIVASGVSSSQAAEIHQRVLKYAGQQVTSLVAHESQPAESGLKYDIFVVHKLANKRDALVHALDRYKLTPRQIMAVGDGRNDEVLIGAAGIGVALGNAADPTKAVATHVAPSQVNDGAAISLEALLKW